ncbi:MAG: thiamine pyrophosphate-dependent enzyme [Planctomycetota bacterium]
MMTHRQALEVLAERRGDKAVIATMTSAGIWPDLTDTPLDFPFLPSAMGQAPAFGLGIALGQKRGVIVINGDGCTLMNLGCLVTIAAHSADLFLVIMDNGLYEVTGGQATAAGARTDFAAIAAGCGIPRTYSFAELDDWAAHAETALAGPGPVVIVLKVEARLGQKTPKPRRPMSEQWERLRKGLALMI